MASLLSVAQIHTIELPRHARADGEVVVAEAAAQVPFQIVRMFTVVASTHSKRGQHAHRLCSQFMLCVNGAIDIVCDDGSAQRTFALDRGNLALLVPPGIWNTVIFRQANSILIVLCDRGYEAHDYIRDHAEFLAFRKAAHA